MKAYIPLALAFLPANPAGATNLNFTGLALPTCALTVPTDGTLTLQSDLQSWATGVPATINVVNTAPATLSVTRGANWVSSPAQTPTTTFSHTGSVSGINVGVLAGVNDVRSVQLTLLGLSTVSVSLSATAGSPFRAGTHVAQVTVTCTVP